MVQTKRHSLEQGLINGHAVEFEGRNLFHWNGECFEASFPCSSRCSADAPPDLPGESGEVIRLNDVEERITGNL